MIYLEELERLAKAATPGPWDYDATGVFKWHLLLEKRHVCECMTEANSAYIVAACNAVPELIKMYREADDEAADANSAWQKVRREHLALREQVRELERQRDWLADALQNMCAWNQDNESCYVQHVCPAGKLCVCAQTITKYDWIEAAEKAAKEAGE